MTKNNFGWALEALNAGQCICREGWNGKKLFVCKQVPSEISLDIVPNMTSLPQKAKEIVLTREFPLQYKNQMIIVDGFNNISSWVPSSSDLFANDWKIFLLEDN